MYVANHARRRKTLVSRRTGTHGAPSGAAKAARRTVPVMAIAGAGLGLSTAPAFASTHYTVRQGDTLSAIARQVYGSAGEWPAIAGANRSTVPDPDLIYPGERLVLPDAAGSAPQAATAAPAQQPAAPAVVTQKAAVTGDAFGGQLGCGGLEQLWEAAGGNPGRAETAASVAMAESGGNQYAQSPTWDFGYWQIHGSWGPQMATFSPLGNAKAAVYISADGTDWSAWTTFTNGASAGRC